MGTINACLQLDGYCPELYIRWNNLLRAGRISSAIAFKTSLIIESVPADEPFLKNLMQLKISLFEIE